MLRCRRVPNILDNMSDTIIDDGASGFQDEMLVYDFTLGIVKHIGPFISGFKDLTGEWPLVGQSFLQRIVYDGDGFAVHDDSSLSVF